MFLLKLKTKLTSQPDDYIINIRHVHTVKSFSAAAFEGVTDVNKTIIASKVHEH